MKPFNLQAYLKQQNPPEFTQDQLIEFLDDLWTQWEKRPHEWDPEQAQMMVAIQRIVEAHHMSAFDCC